MFFFQKLTIFSTNYCLIYYLKAYKVVDHVFDRCYNDLEPFGRRVRNLEDCQRAYDDRKRFGFE